jgi:hypothetical protein
MGQSKAKHAREREGKRSKRTRISNRAMARQCSRPIAAAMCYETRVIKLHSLGGGTKRSKMKSRASIQYQLQMGELVITDRKM